MLRVERRENTIEVFENLRRKGISFPNPHELGALLEKHGYGAGEETSVGELITDAGFFWATNDIAAVVDAAQRRGAVCLIAHPGRGGGYTCYDGNLLDVLRRDVPIDGFERSNSGIACRV